MTQPQPEPGRIQGISIACRRSVISLGQEQQAVSTTLAARHRVRQTQLPTCGTPPGWWEMVGASAHAAADEVTVIAQSKTTFLLRWVLFLSLLVSMFIVFAAGSASSVFWVTSVCFRLDFDLSFSHVRRQHLYFRSQRALIFSKVNRAERTGTAVDQGLTVLS